MCSSLFWGEIWWSVGVVAADEVRPGLVWVVSSSLAAEDGFLSFFLFFFIFFLLRIRVLLPPMSRRSFPSYPGNSTSAGLVEHVLFLTSDSGT